MLPRAPALSLLLLAPVLQGAVDFNREVRPLLSDRCFACHGPDSAKREAGLRLDSFEGATTKLESGKQAIVSGNSHASEIFSRIHETDPKEIMPPPKLNRPLSVAERDILVRWIDEGAVYTKHWAFLPAEKHPAPVVKNSAWPKDDLDRFIL
ncbi:MAG: c-type cytochrome domain-containing protein, partial [Verrucomicrobiales bacterium]